MMMQRGDTWGGSEGTGWRAYDTWTRSRKFCFHKERHWYLPENLIRLVTQFQIEPAQFPIVTSNNQVISEWMNVHG